MIALVTGGNGFIGSFLVEKLLEQGLQVRCLVRKTSNLQWIGNLDIELVYGELSDPQSLVAAVQDVDYIYHLAGRTRGISEDDYIAGNYTSTCNLLQAALHHSSHLKKFLYVSSQAAAGPSFHDIPLSENDTPQPVSVYGKSKRMAEEAVLKFSNHFPVTIVRPPSVYGPRDKDFYIMFKNAAKGIVPIAGSGKQKISIIYIDDLIDGILLSAIGTGNEIFFLSGDMDYTWSEIAEQIAQVCNSRSVKFYIPVFIVKIALFFANIYARLTGKSVLLNNDKVKEMLPDSWLCSNQKAKNKLGYQPKTTLQEGIQKTADWYKTNGWL